MEIDLIKRRAMTPKRKAAILLAHDCKCWRCGEGFKDNEAVEFDHKQALARGGSDEDENIGPCHVPCHKLKTHGTKALRLGSDLFEVRKTKRMQRKNADPKKSKHNWPKRSMSNVRFKKNLDGKVEKRD